MNLKLLACASLFLTFFLTANEKNQWPDKHGPTLNGVVPKSSASVLPLKWDGESKKNIAWKTPLKDLGHSSPIIYNNKIWLTSANATGTKQYIYCIDAKDGKVIHHKLLFENAKPESLGNPTNTYATPSCVVEEGAVYVHFGTYGTAKLNPDTADIVWQRRDIKVRHFRGPASSPIIYKNMLILSFDGVDRQFTQAIDKNTGKDIWLTKRSVDYKDLVNGKPKREGDFRKAFNTPNIAMVDGKAVLLSVGARAGYGYDAETGKELWILKHKNMNAAVRPVWVPEHNTAVINTGSSKATLVGLKLDANTSGDQTPKAIWTQKRSSRYCLPLYLDNHIYQVTHDGTISCSNIKSGEKLWTKSIPNKFMASPLLVGDKVYAFDEYGKTIVFEANTKEFKVLAENIIDEGVSASPAVADGAIFLRTKKALYRISK